MAVSKTTQDMSKEINIAREFCFKLGWKYKDAGEFIILGFDVDNLTKPIFIKQKHISSNGNPIIEISYLGYDLPEDSIQQSKITMLLSKRNQTLIFGQWSIKNNAGYDCYEFRYNIEQKNLDIEKFSEIIGICIDEIKYLRAINTTANT